MRRLLIVLLLLSPLVFGFQNKTFDWVPPTQNTDGSPLPNAEIGSYNIYCNGTLLGNIVNTNGTDTWESPDGSLPPGTYDCHGTAVNTAGVESSASNTVNFIVADSVPNPPTGFSVTLP